MEESWFCENCDKDGIVTYRKGADVWEVFQKILDDHKQKSPECEGGRDTIRVSSTTGRIP